MHIHYSMFGFLDSPQYIFYHIFPWFLFWLEKKSVASTLTHQKFKVGENHVRGSLNCMVIYLIMPSTKNYKACFR